MPPVLMTLLSRFLAAWVLLTIGGCITPGQRYENAAATLGVSREIAMGQPFTHVIWRNNVVRSTQAALHIYIEGDGTPWVAGVPAADPAPRQPMALQLMAVDPKPAVLVGRPCYHAASQTVDCSVRQWTSARYSAAVVESMAVVIERLRTDGGYQSVVLIGYSGGGVLATLLAPIVEPVDAVVTIGANLDTNAWTMHHSYTTLAASVNPADQPAAAQPPVHVHYVGRNDAVVPPATRRSYFAKHAYAQDIVIDDFGHVCCWAKAWPRLLHEALDQTNAAR